jgi:GH25 family lysozyme M1 (1,4-beta-N-acetylmuramidase)
MSAAAAAQIGQYRDHTNGLADHGHDPVPRPDPIPVFQYRPGGTPGDGVQPLPVRGIDMSHHNAGPVRWSLMRSAGVRFAYHKVTEGSSFVDPAYRPRRAEIVAFNKSLGILTRLLGRTIRPGGYHYASPDGGDAAIEARFFIKHLITDTGDVAPYLDFETLGKLKTLAEGDRWCVTFIRTAKAEGGLKRFGIYPGGFDLPLAVAEADFVVRPRYNSTNTPPTLPWDVWQFSDGSAGVPHTVPGYGGNLDLNTLRKGFRVRKMRLRKAGVTPVPAPVPDPKPTPDPKPPPAPKPTKPQRVVVAAHNGQFGHKLADKRIDIAELESGIHAQRRHVAGR